MNNIMEDEELVMDVLHKEPEDVMWKLPKNTPITTYYRHKSGVIGVTKLPDGRYLLKIVYCWDDGEIMEFGYDFGEGTQRGLNPLHIIKIYQRKPRTKTIEKDLKQFMDKYYPIKYDKLDYTIEYDEVANDCYCGTGGCKR